MGRLPERELLVECVTSVEYDVKRDANISRYDILIYTKDLQSNLNRTTKRGCTHPGLERLLPDCRIPLRYEHQCTQDNDTDGQ